MSPAQPGATIEALSQALLRRLRHDSLFAPLFEDLWEALKDAGSAEGAAAVECALVRHRRSPNKEAELNVFVGHLVAAAVDHGLPPASTRRLVRLAVQLSDEPARLAV
ncbi:MAG: hypothetical protein AAF411_01815 [Myxococcota bacterium]